MNFFWKQFRFYRLHYLVISFIFFLSGWLLSTKGAGQIMPALFACLLYSFGITFNAFVIGHYLLPVFLYKKRKLIFIACTLLLITTTGFLLFYFQTMSGESVYLLQVKNNRVISFLLSYFSPLAFSAIITTVIDVFQNQQSTILKMEKLNAEKTQTELSFLKAQINPHFLFNALNSIYFQIDKQNTPARDTLMKFTEMLRYQLYECNVESVAIANEIHFLKNYIALQQLRKGDGYSINLTADEMVKGFSIAPLILINFVENAFKHVSNKQNGENIIDVKLHKDGDHFVFTCFNTTDETTKQQVFDFGGIGLNNVKRRLDIAYNDNYSLIINNETNTYTAILKINCTDNECINCR
jgi:two-component system, LytTR family, sensor kinase